MKTLKKTYRYPVAFALAVLMAAAFAITKLSDPAPPGASAAVGGGSALSLSEIGGDFSVMLVQVTNYKTLVYVDRLYFDYNPQNNKRLHITKNEDTDFCVIKITNAAGEWASVWGYVREEEGCRPDDPLQRITTVHYLEIHQSWEWRTFTNEENWRVTVKDGYVSTGELEFTFDLGDRKDGAVYYIDGHYALPEHYYPQVARKWEVTAQNRGLLDARDDYLERALDAVSATPEGEPLKLDPVEYKCPSLGGAARTAAYQSANAYALYQFDGNFDIPVIHADETTWRLGALFFVCPLAAFICGQISGEPVFGAWDKSTVPTEGDSRIKDYRDPNQRDDDGPPAPTDKQEEEYQEAIPDLTEEEREELEKHKEFSLDNDAPTGQKIVKLKVKDVDGNLQDVYDENGNEVYVNRKTYTVGNSTYALINRETLLLIRYWPTTNDLKDIVGSRITVNADNKIMNMDGAQPYSPRSKDDVVKKLADMGKYTSAIDPARMLYRMDDDDALRKAMALKENNVSLGFWATIKNALKNIFGSGSGSKGFLSNFLDIVVLLGVIAAGIGGVAAVGAIIGAVKKSKGG